MQEEKELSPQQSLRLIHQMIINTKNTIGNDSPYFLLWGWAVLIGCLLQYYLKVVVGYPKFYYAWLITPLVLVANFFLIYRNVKYKKVKTFIDEANAYLWTAIGLSFLVLAFVFTRIGWQYSFPFYILLYGVGTFISGSLIKFKPLVIGGLFCFPISALSVYTSFDTQTLLTAFAVLISYIVPGHILHYQYHKNTSIIHSL